MPKITREIRYLAYLKTGFRILRQIGGDILDWKFARGITGWSENLGRNDGPVKEPNWWPCLMELRLAFCLSFRMRHANEKRLRTKKFMSDKKRDRKQQWEHLWTKAQGECHNVKKTATNPFLRYWTARHWCSCVRRVHGDALNDSLLRKQLFKKHLPTLCFSFLLSNIKKNLAWKTCRLC